jgi:hypothetical protein
LDNTIRYNPRLITSNDLRMKVQIVCYREQLGGEVHKPFTDKTQAGCADSKYVDLVNTATVGQQPACPFGDTSVVVIFDFLVSLC